MLGIFPAAIEESNDAGEDRQQHKKHLRHRLNQSTFEADWVDDRASEQWLHHRWSACDILERRIPLRLTQRLLLVDGALRRVGNSLRPWSRRLPGVGGYADIDAPKRCVASAESQIRSCGGDKKVDKARGEIESKRRDVASATPLQKLVRQHAGMLKQRA